MKRIYKIILLTFIIHSFIIPILWAQNNKTKFIVEIKNSIGLPQNEAFIKISGRSDTYRPDSLGVIRFEYEVPQSYKRTANIYLNSDKNKSVKCFTLDKNNNSLSFIIDTKNNLLEFKKENNTFAIEGIVTDEEGKPISGAVVSIQGTGRNTLTDEIGLFSIEADYNHYIIIRADGMENMTLNITPFLSNKNEAYNIKMKPKGKNRVYTSVEKKPQYPGGMGYFKKYIDRNLKYPEQAKKDSIEGVVVMQFIVEKNGEITNPKVVRNLEPTLDSIAVNLIKGMPRWTPGSDHGIIVRCKYSIPISFKIPTPKPNTEKKDTITTDSIKMVIDSIKTDSLSLDSLKQDSLLVVNDSIQNDSIITSKDKNTVKVKKRNAFVRFFRWLFGIKDKEKVSENEILENKATNNSQEKKETPIDENKIKPNIIQQKKTDNKEV